MFTIVIMSLHSRHHLTKFVEKIDENIPIVIFENSQDYEIKEELEKKFKNVRFIIPEKNLGFAKGANLAISQVKTEYIFLNPADVFLSNECLNQLIECINEFSDFAMLAPTYRDETIYRNYELYSSYPKLDLKVAKKFGIKEVDIIDGTFVIKKSEFNKIGFFDENIFIYFETWDLSRRITKAGKKMYVCDNIKFDHLGGQSHNPKFNYEATLSRNWHFNWARFYYFRKYHNYFYAFKKSLPVLLRSCLKSMKQKITGNKKEYNIHMAEVKGILSAYFLKESSYRPYEISKSKDKKNL